MMPTGAEVRMFVSLVVVIGLLAAFLWALRRGLFHTGALSGRSPVAVETAVALGDRRSLVVVSVEGRRLLLGATPGSLTLITELKPGAERSAS